VMAGLVRRKPTKKITASQAREILTWIKSNKTVVKLAREGHFRMIPSDKRTSPNLFFEKEILDFERRREERAA
jgi:hypothetical protein